MMYRRVQCVPPSYVTIYVLNNRGNDGWVELEVEVHWGKWLQNRATRHPAQNLAGFKGT